jgi:predicted enzyme related to lactoylglutathione lyase
MKIRTIYFKVTDIPKAAKFWETVLQLKPHKTFDSWHEFMCGNVRLGLLLCDDKTSGANCVPVFEFTETELPAYIERAKAAGAKVLIDGFNDPNMKSFAMADPWGNEFELSKFHD